MTAVDLEFDQLNSTVDALRRSISNRMMYGVGKDAVTAHPHDWLHAAALAVRDRLVARWMKTTRLQYEQDVKRVYYLSMEFLIGRLLYERACSTSAYRDMRDALAGLGVDLDALRKIEPDAALGNGGLGRLAACFIESMATLGIPAFGYGIRYEYGMFRQSIAGRLAGRSAGQLAARRQPLGVPAARGRLHGSLRRPCRTVHDAAAAPTATGIRPRHVHAIAYDTAVVGLARPTASTRCACGRRAPPTHFDLDAFNRGDYAARSTRRTCRRTISRCSIRTTRRRPAANCACGRNTSSSRRACRI